jgi:hypothetical protein
MKRAREVLDDQINRCISDADTCYRISCDPPQARRVNEYQALMIQVD